jgi:hypothetical protein
MRRFLVLTVAVLAPAVASGEMLKGAVKDSSNTPLSGAMVLIHWDHAGNIAGLRTNIGIAADLNIGTKDDGTFTADLPPGFYDIFVAATAFTPTCRKLRMNAGEAQEIAFRLDLDPLYTAEMGNRVEGPKGFERLRPDYVPDGTATPLRGVAAAEECESACGSSLACKAYAFDTVKFACYSYSEVFMGETSETRRMGIYSSGLSVLPKTGFISAFKRSSFPPPPIPAHPPK